MRLFDIFKKPLVAGITGGILGLFFGLVVLGWNLWPVTWTNADPAALSPDHKAEYLRMAADSFALNQNTDLAKSRIEYIGAAQAAQILDPMVNNPGSANPAGVMKLRDGARAMAEAQGQAVPTQAPSDTNGEAATTPSIFSNPIVLAGAGILALAVMVGGVYIIWSRLFRGRRPASPEEYSAARQAQEINKVAAEAKTDFTKLGLQEPTSRTMTTYVLGDDLYDESFSIDAQSGEFLGEYGVGVSEAIGVGDPKKVTAIEIWLFDKNDIKTATKVLMTPHAFNDPNLRNKLEAKGELVMLEPHGQVLLETKTLQLLVTAVDLEYGQSNLPDKSYFDRITLELAVWPK